MKNVIKSIAFRIQHIRKEHQIKKKLLLINHYLDGKGVKMLYVSLPSVEKIKNLTNFEKERHNNWTFDFNHADKEIEKLKLIFGPDVTSEYILSVFDGGIVVQGEKRKVLLDFSSENQHIINGRRITIGI